MVLNLFGFEEQNYDSGSKMGQPLNAIFERVIFEISKGLDTYEPVPCALPKQKYYEHTILKY